MKHIFYDWYGFNQSLFVSINYITNHGFLQKLFMIISKLFNVFAFLLYYVLLLLFIFFKLRNDKFSKESYDRYFEILLKIGLTYVAIILAYTVMKFGINLPRPYCIMENFISIQNFAHERCLSSFPSAHTAMAVFMYYISFQYLSKGGKLLGAIVVVLVGASRISLAMHFPADVLYSIIICLFICQFMQYVLNTNVLRNYITLPIRDYFYAILINLFNLKN